MSEAELKTSQKRCLARLQSMPPEVLAELWAMTTTGCNGPEEVKQHELATLLAKFLYLKSIQNPATFVRYSVIGSRSMYIIWTTLKEFFAEHDTNAELDEILKNINITLSPNE